MSHDLRWAARYAFTEDLWRGRPRVVLDASLEAALRDGRVGALGGSETDDALVELVDDLIPVHGDPTEPVWMAVANEDTAIALRRVRAGTTFITYDQLAETVGRVGWDAALLEIDALPEGADGDLAAAADALGLRPFGGRHVVLWGLAQNEDDQPGLAYGDLADLVLERLACRGSKQRLFGLYRPSITAVVDFGESLEAEAEPEVEEVDAHGDGDGSSRETEITISLPRDVVTGGEDEIPLVFDNTLGAQEPPLLELIAITSPRSVVEGLSLIETPVAAGPRSAGLQVQLDSAQLRADRADVERQTLLDRVDALSQENDALREALEEAETLEPTLETSPFDALARDEALEASMGREQALKWKVSSLEHQLARAVARPVEALEAEVAQLREQLRAQQEPNPPPPASGSFEAPSSTSDAAVPADPPIEPAPTEPAESKAVGSEPVESESVAADLGAGSAEPAHTGSTRVGGSKPDASSTATRQVAAQMTAVMRRLERGGIGVLELRRDLAAMAKRLRSR